MVAEILMMTEDFRNSLNRKIITFLSWLLPCNITTFFYQFPDCMIGTYGVLKLPVISNFLPSPTVTVLMTMVKEKLVSNYFANIFLWTLQFDEILFSLIWHISLQLAVLMKTVPSLVSMVHCNEDSKNNYCSSKCNNKSLALNKEEHMYEIPNSQTTKLLSCDIMMNFFTFLCFNCLILSHF